MSILSHLVKGLQGNNQVNNTPVEEKLPTPDETFLICIQQTEDYITNTFDGLIIKKNQENNSESQLWIFTKDGYLKHKNTGLLLSASGENVALKQEKGEDSQKWIIQGTSIVNKSSGLYLSFKKKENKIILTKKNSINVSKWKIVKEKENPKDCIECGAKIEVLCLDCNQFFCEYCSDTLHQLPNRIKHQKFLLFEKCNMCNTTSKYVCLDCNTHFCINCAKLHSVNDHRMSLLEKKQQTTKKKKIVKKNVTIKEKCSECLNNEAEMYCFKCDNFQCSNCHLILHAGTIGSTIEHQQMMLFKNCLECQEQAVCFCPKCNSEYCQICCGIFHKLQHNDDHIIFSIDKYIKNSELEMSQEERLEYRKSQRSKIIENIEKKAKIIESDDIITDQPQEPIGTACVEEKRNFFTFLNPQEGGKHSEDENIPILQTRCEEVFFNSLKSLKYYDEIFHGNRVKIFISNESTLGIHRGSLEPQPLLTNSPLSNDQPSLKKLINFGSVASESESISLFDNSVEKTIKPIKEPTVKNPYLSKIGKVQTSSVNDSLVERIDPNEKFEEKKVNSNEFLVNMISQKKDPIIWNKNIPLLPYEG